MERRGPSSGNTVRKACQSGSAKGQKWYFSELIEVSGFLTLTTRKQIGGQRELFTTCSP
jgi:hypothetical protein